MKKNTSFFLVLILATLLSCDTYHGPQSYYPNSEIKDRPNEPGKCYAKCLSPETIEEVTLTVEIYNGNDPEILKNNVKDKIIELAPEFKKWEKKKADRNCLSANPEDCLVWCLVTKPAQTITVKNMLLDTTVTNDYVTEIHTVDYVSQIRNQETWMAVLCDPDDKQLEAIQNALNDRGYDLSVEILQRNFGQASKKALTKFQQDNQLYVGGITEESMDALGIDY